MRFARSVLLTLAMPAVVAQTMAQEKAESATEPPPIRPVPTSVPLRPNWPDSMSIDLGRTMPQQSEPRQRMSKVRRVLAGGMLGGLAVGVISYNVARSKESPDCVYCELDALDVGFSGFLVGAIIGGVIAALTYRGG